MLVPNATPRLAFKRTATLGAAAPALSRQRTGYFTSVLELGVSLIVAGPCEAVAPGVPGGRLVFGRLFALPFLCRSTIVAGTIIGHYFGAEAEALASSSCWLVEEQSLREHLVVWRRKEAY